MTGCRMRRGSRLTRLCGFAAGTGQELDDHFLAVFTPGDRTGRDGRVHAIQRQRYRVGGTGDC